VDDQPSTALAWWELGWARWLALDLAGTARCWSEVQRLDPSWDQIDLWVDTAKTRATYRGFDGVVEPNPTEASGPTIRFVAGGDTMMGSDLRGPQGLPPDPGALFDDLRPILTKADVTFLNLEGPLADGLTSDKCGPASATCYAFQTPTKYVSALKDAGLDLASLANNHAFDVGPEGQLSTMKTLDSVGIAHAGRYGDTALIERDGVKIAMVAAHSGSCCLNVNDLEEVRAAVALADRQADLVVFAYHGGMEGSQARHVLGKTEIAWGEARGNVLELAHTAIDAGADLVLGTGPHVLRAMEVYQGRLIAYSLGNFLGYDAFGKSSGYGDHSVLLDVELAGNGVLKSARLHPIALDDHAAPHPDPERKGLDHVRELSAADFPATGVKVGEDGVLSW
jgi:poly-gamma-glutamate capsule biosynthesis protein CapA/YwtB (metallophosphatase superfamily)